MIGKEAGVALSFIVIAAAVAFGWVLGQVIAGKIGLAR